MQHTAGEIYGTLSPELRLVILCSKLKIQEKEQEAIQELITGHINWGLFLHLILHHKVYPLVYRYLSTLEHPAVPGEVVAALRQKSLRNSSQTLRMIAALIRVVRAMAQNGIRVVVMKGFPLAYRLYGDMTLRPSRDLDILVWPEDMDKARRVIEKNGYFLRNPRSKLTSEQMRKWMETNQHLYYWHPDEEICLELHWRLDCHGMDIPRDRAENSLTNVQIAGQSISVLGKEELLLYLVLHGAVHAWFRMRWLYDVDIMIRQGDFSWKTLYQLADSLGVKTVLNQALILSRDLLRTPIPVDIVNKVTTDTKARALTVMALGFITNNDYNPKSPMGIALLLFQWKRYQFYLQSRWRKRLCFIFKSFLPSEEDLEMISLSKRLYFMYYMMSPFTWFGRRMRNVARRYNLYG